MREPETVGEILDNLAQLHAKQEVAHAQPTSLARAVTPMQLLQLAMERGGADIDMMARLMDLNDRFEAGEARKAFVAALAEFKKNPPRITKNKHVSFESRGPGGKTEYDHATLDQVCNAVVPALAEQGLSHTWEIGQIEGMIEVTCVLTHVLGHSSRTPLKAGADLSGGKNSIQAVASTVSYLERYTLLAATGLAVEGQDDDGKHSGAESISAAQVAELEALIKETSSSMEKFLRYLAIDALDELPVSAFVNARGVLLARKKAKERAGGEAPTGETDEKPAPKTASKTAAKPEAKKPEPERKVDADGAAPKTPTQPDERARNRQEAQKEPAKTQSNLNYWD